MPYDPILTSFITVGVVGGVAAVMNVSADWGVTHELAQATENWTTPLVSRRYRRDGSLFERRRKEVSILREHGYHLAYERGDGALHEHAATAPPAPPGPVTTATPLTEPAFEAGADDDAAPAEPLREAVVVIYQRT